MSGSDAAAVDPIAAMRALLDEAVAAEAALDAGRPGAGITSTAPAPLPLTDASMRAAIAHSFRFRDPEESAPPGPDDVERGPEDEASALLACALPVIIGGQRRLRLTNGARADLLRRAWDQQGFQELLNAKAAEEREVFDAITGDAAWMASAWLRAFLVGNFGNIHRAPPDELRAAAAARESLDAFSVRHSLPSLDEVRRALAYAELLEPLQMLVGIKGGWDQSVESDRFAGRERELRKLRAFVDEVPAESLGESAQRSYGRVVKGAARLLGLDRAALLTVVARGGMGKSSLIAKFVLDHAVRHDGADAEGKPPRNVIPFVYLDFDRATLRGPDPRLLILETIRQIAFQFPAPREDLDALAEKVRAELDGMITQSSDHCAGLREALRSRAGRQRLLMVLDTFEAVQFDSLALKAVDGFLAGLIGEDGFAGLRIVVAGRQELNPDMLVLRRVSARALNVPPLRVAEAAEMADKRGRSLLGRDWDSEWARRIAGVPRDRSDRREPLSIRVAVELLTSAPREEREALSREIQEKGEEADASFVGQLYERRVLGHLMGGRAVARLAWPGLVFRNVTKEMAEGVLAKLCGLTPEEGRSAFDDLAREVWLVDVRTEPDDTTVLRHQRDLRARTLPLMRRYEPAERPQTASFDAVNQAAIAYFKDRRHTPDGRAEWIYHRLLGGEEPESVHRDWGDAGRASLADAAADFPPDSPAHLYLLSRTAERLVAPATLGMMEDWMAFDHVERVAPNLGAFDDRRMRPEVIDLAGRQVPGSPLGRAAAAVRRTILAKAGRWDEPAPEVVAGSPWAPQADFAGRYLRARRLEPWEDSRDAEEPVRPADPTPDAYRGLAQDLAWAALTGSGDYKSIDEKLALRLEDLRADVPSFDRAALRVAAIFGTRSCLPAARHWLGSSARNASFSGAELRMVAQAAGSEGASLIADALPQLRKLLPTILKSRIPARIEASDLVGLLTGAARIAQPLLDQATRRFFAQRREDWIVPFAYACARATSHIDAISLAPVVQRQDDYESSGWLQHLLWSSRGGQPRFTPEQPDFVLLMRRADEASDLAGMASLVLELAGENESSTDLQRLVTAEAAWSAGIERWIEQTVREDRGRDERVPRPGPIVVEDDPQKRRWGGLAARDGRRLSAEFTPTPATRRTFQFDLVVESTDGSPLEPPVLFHLHPTFEPSLIRAHRVTKGRCTLHELRAWGAFTTGAQVRCADGTWTALELDLAELPTLPEEFRNR